MGIVVNWQAVGLKKIKNLIKITGKIDANEKESKMDGARSKSTSQLERGDTSKALVSVGSDHCVGLAAAARTRDLITTRSFEPTNLAGAMYGTGSITPPSWIVCRPLVGPEKLPARRD